MTFPSEKPVFVYWNILGRAHVSRALLHAGNIEYDMDHDTANSWPAAKKDCPFGQLPVLKHGDLVLAQSGAIARYCARLAGLYPSDPIAASKCDMIMEECVDLTAMMGKAKYPGGQATKEDKVAAWENIKTTSLPAHLGCLETILEKSGSEFFGGEAPNAADVVFTAVYDMFVHGGFAPDTVDSFPKLKNVVEKSKQLGTYSSYNPGSPYYTCNPDSPMF